MTRSAIMIVGCARKRSLYTYIYTNIYLHTHVHTLTNLDVHRHLVHAIVYNELTDCMCAPISLWLTCPAFPPSPLEALGCVPVVFRTSWDADALLDQSNWVLQ